MWRLRGPPRSANFHHSRGRYPSDPCEWSIADFDSLGSDPRALAAKGFYLSSFIGFGAKDRGTVKEADIRDLYARSAKSWRSPIPYVLEGTTLEGLGSQHSIANAGCIRDISPSLRSESDQACKTYDEAVLRELRDLTLALVIDPQFSPALSARAEKYLALAESHYADGKPSRALYDLAIKDFTAALAASGSDQHMLYADRAIALASLGNYKSAVDDYEQAIKHADGGAEGSPFLCKQLANLYMKLGEFNKATNVLTQAIINGSMPGVILGGGIGAFRELYPEYETLPRAKVPLPSPSNCPRRSP